MRSINKDSAFKKKGCSGNLRSQPHIPLVCGEMVQGVLRGQTISMTVTDLFKNDHAFLVENEGRRVCGLVGSVPTKPIEIRHCIVWIGHQHDIRRKLGLLFKKLIRITIEG